MPVAFYVASNQMRKRRRASPMSNSVSENIVVFRHFVYPYGVAFFLGHMTFAVKAIFGWRAKNLSAARTFIIRFAVHVLLLYP